VQYLKNGKDEKRFFVRNAFFENEQLTNGFTGVKCNA